MKTTYSSGGIVYCCNKVAVVSNNGTSWTFPKGHIDKGEDPLTTAKREIYEETGLKELILIKDLGCYERSSLSEKDTIKNIHMCLFTCNQKKLCPVDPLNPEARWIPINEVTKLLTHEKEQEFFLSQLPLTL
ncbi:hypothetical protein CMO92_04270 [Candidatus Woesearchaeota archaeon]|nr:hypothetical protein [Candidatus Woesearchaeota archaeon]|tara:strand:+ start:999 stop:1394 length:396 start_codon:yes stop_codon:yes gene_type:complete